MAQKWLTDFGAAMKTEATTRILLVIAVVLFWLIVGLILVPSFGRDVDGVIGLLSSAVDNNK